MEISTSTKHGRFPSSVFAQMLKELGLGSLAALRGGTAVKKCEFYRVESGDKSLPCLVPSCLCRLRKSVRLVYGSSWCSLGPLASRRAEAGVNGRLQV